MDVVRNKTYLEDDATSTNSPTVIHANTTQTVTGWRRCVALFALCSWILSAIACPMPDVAMDHAQLHDTIAATTGHSHEQVDEHGHDHSQAQDSTAPDPCCQILSHTQAIAQPLTSPEPDAAPPPTFLLTCEVAPSLIALAPATAPHIPRANGPPRNFYRRFAFFWSNAPPTRPV